MLPASSPKLEGATSPTRSTTSPGRMPATAAAESGCTWPTTGRSTPAKASTAKMMSVAAR